MKKAERSAACKQRPNHEKAICKLRELLEALAGANDALTASKVELTKADDAARKEITLQIGGYEDPNFTIDERFSAYRMRAPKATNADALMEVYNNASKAYSAALAERERIAKELEALAQQLVRERKGELMEAYEALLDQGEKILRPLCLSESEARDLARVLPVPTAVHERYAELFRNSSFPEALIRELEQPIPNSPEQKSA